MTRPQLFEKRPSTVEAWQWDGGLETADLIVNWIESNSGFAQKHPHENFIVLGNDIDTVKPGDWVVRDRFGDFWPLPDPILRATYKTLL